MTTTPEKRPKNCKNGIHADGMCYCLEDKPTPEAERIEERRKFIEVFYKDFNDYNDIDVKFEDVYQYHHHQLQKARQDIHTSLVVAVEGLKKQAPYTYDDDMCQALDNTLTIINSIFKE